MWQMWQIAHDRVILNDFIDVADVADVFEFSHPSLINSYPYLYIHCVIYIL